MIQSHIEAIIFASEDGIGIDDLLYVLQASTYSSIREQELSAHLIQIKLKYDLDEHIFSLNCYNQKYQFLTKKTFHPIIQQLEAYKNQRKLSQAAIETLAIIAYQQPVTKLQIEEIRGVNCDYSIQKLLDKNLIQIKGKAESIGKPILYGTSAYFMNYFGIKSMHDLPQKKDIESNENTIGDMNE